MTITCLIAHIDHGKTTLLDCLLAYHNLLLNRNTGIKLLDTRDDEQIRGITLKLSFIKLINIFNKSPYYFIDTPGHYDIESYIEAAMFLSTSTIILIDLQEGLTPRTISLFRFINNKSILFLNKLDKLLNNSIDIYNEIQTIIEKCNGIIGDNIFDFEKNNIIIGSSLNRYGFNKKLIKNILNKEINLKNSIKFFISINYEINKNNKEKIFKKFNIKNWWNVLGEIFPIAECIFQSINDLNEINYNINYNNIKVNKKFNLIEYNYQNIYLLEKFNKKLNSFTGITTSAINFIDKFNKDNSVILFVVKPFNKLEVGMLIYSETEKELKHSKILNIYKLEGMEFIKCLIFNETDGICFVEADFLKKSFLFEIPVYASKEKDEINYKNMRIKNTLKFIKQPFYQYLMIPISPIKEFKERIKKLSLTENLLKAKINKFGEIEMLLEGKIHLEKLLYDLKDLKYKEGKLRDKSYPTINKEINFKTKNYSIKIIEILIDSEKIIEEIKLNKSIKKFYDEIINLELNKIKQNHKNNLNIFSKYCVKRTGNFIAEYPECNDLSVLIYSLPSLFNVIISIEIFFEFDFEDLLKNIKNLIPNNVEYSMFYQLELSIDPSHVGILYQSINKYGYTLLSEDIDNNFLLIKILIQRKVFNNLRDDIINKMRGQVAMKIKEIGYLKLIKEE